ncbi:MAG TPA: MarR family transcriptional regulator [Acetobacteraceae bacterium]|jgi:predicted transcriptional regulator|nr:MarR family transcriptional regulator [Acetobacteraceae bacterium]
MSEVKVVVGGTMEEDAADLLDAWHRTEQGEQVLAERVLAFESFDGLFKVLTGERFRMLRHLHNHPEPSISALARSLGRQYSRVHADVAALQAAGLLERSKGALRATADRIMADIRL